MTEDPFDRLLDAMPKIAEAVNAFSSEEVQRRAFDALLGTLGTTVADHFDDPPTDAQWANRTAEVSAKSALPASPAATDENGDGQRVTNAGGRRRSRVSTSKKTWAVNRNINFAPPDKPSLRDVADEKKPKSNKDKNLVAAYYLTEHLSQETFDVSDVMGAFKFMAWPLPSNPANSLQVVASTLSWFDTKDMSKIQLTHIGSDYCEHKLPCSTKKR
ncbi:MAG: hypothetical protein ACRDTX_22550 [Pseudonocardiaceae bacterium]